MRRLAGFLLLLLLVPAAAQAQGSIYIGGSPYIPRSPEGWYYKIVGNQFMMIQAEQANDLQRLIRDAWRPLTSSMNQMAGWGDVMGLRGGMNGFYPMYRVRSWDSRGPKLQPLTTAGKWEVATGVTAAIGGTIASIVYARKGEYEKAGHGALAAFIGQALIQDGLRRRK